MAKFSVGRSRSTIDLRKKRPGIYRELFPFPKSPKTSHSSPSRKSPLRARRRRTRVIVSLGVLVGSIGLAWGVGYATYLPQFSINTIEISGASDISPKLVRTYVETQIFDGANHFFSRGNMFLYPRRTLEENIREYFPRIHKVQISRESFLAQAIQVTVEERAPRARWCADDSCYYMDDNGFIFAAESTSTPPTIRYTFTGALPFLKTSPIGQRFLPEHLPDMFTLLERLERAGFVPTGISTLSEQDFSVMFETGFMLRASFEEDPEKIARNLELVLSSDSLREKENELQYIDLRFGNRVYYKFFGGAVESQ